MPENYKPVDSIPRTAPGIEPRQRPQGQTVEPLDHLQHDHVYHKAHVGPITAELVRPDVGGKDWGGYDLEKLRIAGLARAVQVSFLNMFATQLRAMRPKCWQLCAFPPHPIALEYRKQSQDSSAVLAQLHSSLLLDC